jgi:AcrR family transcriptional regulator
MQRILAAGERVLASEGFEDFTMAAVAQAAGVSVGALYRRYAGKEQLLYAVKDEMLTRLEQRLETTLRTASTRGLDAVVDAYTRVLSDTFSSGARAYTALLTHQHGPEAVERGKRAHLTMQRLFVEAASAHIDQIGREDPTAALVAVATTITAACITRTAAHGWWPDGLSWGAWRTEIADMAVAHLRTPNRGNR